ncbi:serine/threonine-protein kinase [Nocardia caishijiensis]|uniref:non-specific serine/threonine protein kinase n=2 Tax=Nocardia caishijiensis TaxID=184756 RepID=A0ABQ6YSU0_9NOCA|nr:serine/threonine-protein kinase [Nocardia caishijiensis]
MAGAMFGRYELRRLLGVGGMGEVYEAFDTTKDRVVALKVLNRELAADPTYVQRFRRESHAMASVQEPHVIPVHDWGEVDGVLYIDMRLVKGSDLKERLQQHGRLTPGEAVQVVEQIAAALDAAHELGLVHRDVKPANILLTANLFAYLVDFGIAHGASDPQLTSAGSAVGSMAYMAPERFEEAPMTSAVDTYALTCVLYESLVGRVPFPVNSLAGAIGSHQMAPPPRPSAADSTLSAFDAVIERGMAKRPDQRYGSPGDLARAARAALVQAERDAPATVPGPRVTPLVRQPPPRPVTGQTRITGPQPPPPTAPSPAQPRPAAQRSAPQPIAGFPQSGRPQTRMTTGPQQSGPQQTRMTTGPQHSAAVYAHPSEPLPLPPQRNSATPILAGALGALIVVAAVGVAVWIMLSVNDSGDKRADQPVPTSAVQVPPPVVTVSQDVPTEVPQVPPTGPKPTTTTVPPLNSAVTGADGQGFLSGGPRCNDNDAAMTIARTTTSRVVICHTGAGRYYYKGVAVRNGNAIELDDPVPTGGGGFTATNPSDGTQYQVTPAGLTITRDSSVLASEAMLEFAHR